MVKIMTGGWKIKLWIMGFIPEFPERINVGTNWAECTKITLPNTLYRQKNSLWIKWSACIRILCIKKVQQRVSKNEDYNLYTVNFDWPHCGCNLLKNSHFYVTGSPATYGPNTDGCSNVRETGASFSPLLQGCQLLVVACLCCFQFPLFFCNLVPQCLQSLALMPTGVCRFLHQPTEWQ